MRKTALIKISGDLYKTESTLQFIKEISEKYFTVVCVGGGTQINETFKNNNLPITKHGPLGREINTFAQRQLARDVLESNQVHLQDTLAKNNIYASVVIPVIDIGTVLCHVNGDTFVLSAYHGYDIIYVCTTEDRVDKKQDDFNRYKKKIHIKGF